MKKGIFLKALLILLLGLLFVPSSSFGAGAGRYPVTRYNLKNGLTVLLQPVPEAPVVSVAMVYKVGSRDEKPGLTGMSYIIQHIIQKNTKNYPKGRMAALLHRVGADFSSFTSSDVTGFYETLAPEYLPLALHIEADRMSNGLVDAASLSVEKKVALSEVSAFKSQPSYQLWQQVRASSFTRHPYMWPVQGYENDIRNLKPQQLKWYYNYYYRPSNGVLAVVGNFDVKKTKALIQKLYGSKKNPKIPIKRISVTEPPSIAAKSVSINYGGRYPILHMAYRSPSIKSKDLYAMAVIDALLTGGRTGRLRKSLVTGGYTRTAEAWLDTNVDPGLYHMRFTLRTGQKLESVEKTVVDQLEKLKTEPVLEEELTKAKNRLKADFVKAKDSVTFQAQYLAWYEGIDSYRYLLNYPAEIEKVTAADVARVASEYFKASNRTVGRLIPKTTDTSPDLPPTDDNGAPTQDPEPENNDTGMISGLPLSAQSIVNEATLGGSLQVAAVKKKTTVKKKYFAPKKTAKKAASKTKSKTKSKAKPRKKPAKPKAKPKPKPKAPAYRPYKPPIPAPAPYSLKFKRHVLSNGIVLLIHENRINPSIMINGYVRAGGMYEPADKAGLSKVTAFLLQRGGKNLSASELSSQLDYRGAQLKVSSHLQNCQFTLWTVSDQLENTLPLLAETLTRPAFNPDELIRLKKVMQNNLKTAERTPSLISARDFFAGIFPKDHPFHHFRWGTAETIESITPDDVVNFYQRHYRPDSTIIAVSGDVNAQSIINLFEKNFAQWKASGEPPQLIMPPVALPDATVEKKNILSDAGRVDIIMGHKGISRNHPDYYKFYLLNHILGGGPLVTRLGNALRNRGLAYKITSQLDTSVGEGPWAVKMTVDPGKTTQAQAQVIRQIKEMQTRPPSPRELEDAKYSLMGSLPVKLETNANITRMLLTIEYYRLGDDYVRNYHKAFSQISGQDILDTAKKYLYPERMQIIITGPEN